MYITQVQQIVDYRAMFGNKFVNLENAIFLGEPDLENLDGAIGPALEAFEQ